MTNSIDRKTLFNFVWANSALGFVYCAFRVYVASGVDCSRYNDILEKCLTTNTEKWKVNTNNLVAQLIMLPWKVLDQTILACSAERSKYTLCKNDANYTAFLITGLIITGIGIFAFLKSRQRDVNA